MTTTLVTGYAALGSDGKLIPEHVPKTALIDRIICIPVSNASDSDVSTGDGQGYFRVPIEMNGYNIAAVAACVVTAGTTGTLDIQIRRVRSGSGVDVLSTKSTIDSAEVDTLTAATPAVINGSNDDLATGDQLFIDIDATHTTKPKGLFVNISCSLP